MAVTHCLAGRVASVMLLVVGSSGTAVARAAEESSTTPRAIVTTAPAWFTDALATQLLAHGYAPSPSPEPLRLLGATAPGIHPSQWLQSITVGAGGIQSETCTAGFIFRRGERVGLGAAGHCAPRGAAVSAYVVPPLATGRPPGLYVIGKVILSSGDGAPAGQDFALILISEELAPWVDARMPFWDGPTGVYDGSAPKVVAYVGHGAATGAGGAPRVGYGGRFDDDLYSFFGPSGPGDSGGAVLTADGLAAGNQTHTLLPSSPSDPGIVFGTRVDEMLRQARGWRLVTSPSPRSAGPRRAFDRRSVTSG